jgi:hypothetical protein
VLLERRCEQGAMDLRRDTRYPVKEPCTLRVEGEDGIFLVTVLDVSRYGVRFSTSAHLQPGTPVELLCGGVPVQAEVRYVRNTGKDEYHVGVLARPHSQGPRDVDGGLDLTLLFARL